MSSSRRIDIGAPAREGSRLSGNFTSGANEGSTLRRRYRHSRCVHDIAVGHVGLSRLFTLTAIFWSACRAGSLCRSCRVRREPPRRLRQLCTPPSARMRKGKRESLAQSSICAPISITRSGGMLKNLVAGKALRDMNEKRFTRQRAMPGRLVTTKFSRPRKKVVCSTV